MKAGRGLSRIAFAAGGVSIVVTLVSVVLVVLNGEENVATVTLPLIVIGITLPAVGALVAARQPDNRTGWVILLGSFFYALLLFMDEYAHYATVTSSPALPGGALAAWIGAWIWMPSLSLLLVAMPLIFPDGRLPSRRWRWIAGPILFGTVIMIATQAIWSWGLGAADLLSGRSVTDEPGPIGYLSNLVQLTFVIGPITAAAAVIVRSRRSAGVEREQMRWFTYAITMTVAILVLEPTMTWVPPALLSVGFTIAVLLIPIAIGIAILRYRLYDIDRIISRTIGYVVVTGVLAVVFVGAVLAFSAVLSPVLGESPVAVAASTLIVAALFQPLRRRVQRAVDRRFNRARYDAERTAAAFSDRLRDQVDLATLRSDLIATVDISLRPTQAGLWLRESVESGR